MNIPLSLYIHIPWCVRKCPYCDFNSHTQTGQLPEKEYIAQLLHDLQNHIPDIQGRTIQSIFIGGGTPSLLSADAYQYLFQQMRDKIDISQQAEITLEANPGASEQQRFCGFREAGINRLSLGIQSWQNQKLQILGRVHNAEQALAAVAMAKKAGFNNFNLDIMYGLPQQELSQAIEDLQKSIDCHPTHLSWYQLTIEPNTYFYRFPPALPNDDLTWEIQEQGQKLLAQHGFLQYEISAYSAPGRHSRHNLNYWQFGDYIGIGAGAHSKITTIETGEVWRCWKVKNPRDYLRQEQELVAGKQQIPSQELPLEFMVNTLRLNQAIPLTLFSERTGLRLDEIERSLKKAQRQELLELNSHEMMVTPLGRRFLNDLLTVFMPDSKISPDSHN